MLQALRSKGASIVVKGLFVVLIFSFAIWGIGDYAFLRQSDPAVAHVGGTTITTARLSDEYRREMERLRRAFGQLDPDQARQFGLADRVLDRLVTAALLDLELLRLGLRISDDVVRNRIIADQAFRGTDGAFDRQQFQRLLYDNGLSETRFIELMRSELARIQLTGAIESGATPPQALVDRLYRFRNERRSGEAIFVDPAGIADVGEPDDAAIQAFYDERADRFVAPEYRALTVVRIDQEHVLPQVQVSDQQIREEFDNRRAELGSPEKREIEQILFQDQAKAEAAHAQLAAGTAFADAAREAGFDPSQIGLGAVTREELIPELAEPVFAAGEGTITKPQQSPLGWHILRVVKVVPAREPSLDEVKEKLRADIAARLADEEVYRVSVKIEDELNKGTPLDEAAAKVGLPAIRVAAVDKAGRTPSGERESTIGGDQEILTAGFAARQGQDSAVVETRAGSYFVVRVDGVTPETKKPLDQVRSEVVTLWKAEQRDKAAKARAEEILAKAQGEDSLAEAGASHGLKPAEIPPVPRAGEAAAASGFPAEATAKLFAMKPGERALVTARNGHYVVRLGEIVPAKPETDAEGVERVRAELQRSMAGDLVTQYAEALKRHFGVEINRRAVDSLL